MFSDYILNFVGFDDQLMQYIGRQFEYLICV